MLFVGACLCAQAQWLNQPMAGAPRTPDGKVDLTGPAPRVNGKPDLSGIWQVEAEPRAPGGLFGLGESANSKYFRDILADFKPGEQPLTPAGAGAFSIRRLEGRRWRLRRTRSMGAERRFVKRGAVDCPPRN